MDNYNWSLKEMYESIDSKKFKDDLQNLKKAISDLNIYAENNFKSDKNIEEVISGYIKLLTNCHDYTLLNYLSLLNAVDSNDIAVKKLINTVENIFTDIVNAEVQFDTYLLSIDNLDKIIENSMFLSNYKYFLEEKRKIASFNLTKSEEIIYSKLKLTGSNAWEQLRYDLISGLNIDVEIEGKIQTLPFPAVRNLAYHKDSDVRKNAFLAELDSYKRIDVSIASCLNSIKGEVLTNTNLRNTTPLEFTLLKSRMNKEILDAMLSAMKDSLPKLQKYFLHKAKILGHKEGLPFYDLFAPLGTSNINFTYEEATKYIVDTLNKFSTELGDFVTKAVTNNWIDVLPKAGKRDGAFCSNIPQIGESRIMTNFSGTFSCMVTLAHELGHGYHGECLKNEELLNFEYTMPIAETASIMFETLVVQDALQSVSDDEKITILDSSLTDATQVIVDILSRYIFETNMIEQRKNGNLSVDELNEIMENAQKEAYGEGLSEYHPYMWLCKGHYYSADYNFYNFPYAFGLLFAKGLYSYAKNLNNNEEFMKLYKDLLRKTGSSDLYDLGLDLGIDITKKDFWANSLKTIEDEVDMFLSLK